MNKPMNQNRKARDKYLKWNPGKEKQVKRHVGSADGHARKMRISRAQKLDPKLVEQLKKDLKYELENSSLSFLQKLRNAETASRCLGAMVLRNFIVRALFRQMARAFYTLLTSGVDHSVVAKLKQKVVHQTTTLQEKDDSHQDAHIEVRDLRLRVEQYELAALKRRTKVLKPVVRRYCQKLTQLGIRQWSQQIFAEKHRLALQTRAASYFANRQARLAFDKMRTHYVACQDARSKLTRMGRIVLKSTKRNGFEVFRDNTVGHVTARQERELRKRLQHQVNSLRTLVMVSVLRRNHRNAISKSFYVMRDFAASERRCELILKRATKKLRYKILSRWFRRIQSFSLHSKREKSALRGVVRRTQVRLLNKGVRQWVMWVREDADIEAERDLMRMHLTRILGRITNKYIAAGFESWYQQYMAFKRQDVIMARAAARLKNRRINAAMGSWCEYVDARKHVRSLANRVFGRIVRGKLMMGWYTWQTFLNGLDAEADQLEYQRKLMLRVLSRLAQKQMSQGFRCWVSVVKEFQRRDKILARSAARLKNRKISAAYLTWQAYWVKRTHDRKLAWKMLSRMANAKLSSAFSSWWADVKEQNRHMHIMSKIAAKMKNRTVAAAITTWKEMVREAQATRLLLKRAAARMMRRAVVQTFERWIESVEEIKTARGRMQRAVTKFKNRLASAAFVKWKDTAAEAKRHRVLIRRVALKIKNRTVSSAMESWTDYVCARQDARILCRRVMSRMCNVKVHAAFQMWVSVVTDYKRYIKLLQKTHGRMKNRLASASWTTWTNNVSETKRTRHLLKKAALKIRNRTMSACFDSWYESVQEMKSNKNAVDRAVKMWFNRTYSKAFNTWFENVAEQVRNRTVVQRALKKMTMRKAATALSTWIDFTEERQYMRTLVRKVLGRLLNSKIQAAWRTWLKRIEQLRWEHQMNSLGADEQQAIRDRKLWDEQRAKALVLEQQRRDRAILRVLVRVQNRGLIITFDAWLDCTTEALRVKSLLVRAAAKMAKRGLSASFDGWYESVQDKKQNRLKVKRCLVRIQQRTLVIALDTWVSRIQERKNNKVLVARCLTKIKNRQLDAAYTAWLDYAETRVHQRWLVGRVLGRLLNSKLVAAWSKWCDTIRRLRAVELGEENVLTPAERQCKRVLTRMLNNLTSSAWDSWKSQVQEQRRLEHLLKRVMGKWKNKLLAATFDTWFDAASTQRQHRVLVARAAAKWKMRAAAACFLTWFNKSKQARTDRVRIARCLQKIKNRAMDSAFQGWLNNVDEILQLRARMKQAAMKMKNRKAAMAFGTWCDTVAETKRMRNILQKAAQKMKNRAAASAFTTWSEQWSDRHRVKKLLVIITGKKEKSIVQLSWNFWKTVVAILNSQLTGEMCPRCKRIVAKSEAERKRQQEIDDKERNWNNSTVAGIPQWIEGGGGSVNAGGSTMSGSPSGSGLRGARALAQQSKLSIMESSMQSIQQQQSVLEIEIFNSKEVATLQSKCKRASREAQTLRDRLKRVQAQYELRLQIMATRAEEQQQQLHGIIQQQRSDVQNLQETLEQNKSSELLKTSALEDENILLREEIEKKQKLLQRSITRRHEIEASLVEMNRKWRDKGRTVDQFDDVLNRVSATLSSSSTFVSSSPERTHWRSSTNDQFVPPNEEDVAEMKQFVFQLRAEKKEVERMNAHLENQLQESQLLVEEYTEETERVKEANSAAVSEMSKLAIAHNITQHQKIAALSSAVIELQSKLDEAHKFAMVKMQAKELELGHCRNALRSKEMELTSLNRQYAIAKLEAKSSLAAGASEMSRVLGNIDGGSSILPDVRPRTAGGGQKRHEERKERKVKVDGWFVKKSETEGKSSPHGQGDMPTFLSREAYQKKYHR